MEASPMHYNYSDDTTTVGMDLLAAASIGDLGLVHRLLQQGSNVNQQNESGWTALMYAAHYGHYNVVKMLIDFGSTVNIAEWIQGRTALMLAASCGHTRCLEVLISLGAADIEMTDFHGHNAAYYAIHSGHGRNKIIAKLLKIQQKSRSATRSRPLTKGQAEVTSTTGSSNNGNSSSTNHSNNTVNKHQNSTSSNQHEITSTTSNTTKPDIVIYQDEYPSFAASPLPNGNGNSISGDGGGGGSQGIGNSQHHTTYYSPFLSYNHDESPRGQFTPSIGFPSLSLTPHSATISSPFTDNNGLTPQLTFDRLIGKRRLPMTNPIDNDYRYSNFPTNAKVIRREPMSTLFQGETSSSIFSSNDKQTTLNSLVDQTCKINEASSSNNSVTNMFTHNTNINRDNNGNSNIVNCNNNTNLNLNINGASNKVSIICETGSPSNSNENSLDPRNEAEISCSADSGANVTSSPSTGSGDEGLNFPSSCENTTYGRSRSPLPENLDCLLERIGLSQYVPLFAAHGIDLYCFLTFDEKDLEEIGISVLGHKRKLYMAQLRFRESVEITSTQERFFADWLLSERENLKKENHELKMKLKALETLNGA